MRTGVQKKYVSKADGRLARQAEEKNIRETFFCLIMLGYQKYIVSSQENPGGAGACFGLDLPPHHAL